MTAAGTETGGREEKIQFTFLFLFFYLLNHSSSFTSTSPTFSRASLHFLFSTQTVTYTHTHTHTIRTRAASHQRPGGPGVGGQVVGGGVAGQGPMGRERCLDPRAPRTLDVPPVLTFGKMPEKRRVVHERRRGDRRGKRLSQ